MEQFFKRTYCIIALVCFAVAVQAQGLKVKGKVIDAESGEALPGATISVKSTNIGTLSDKDGMFDITVPKSGTVIVVSFLGKKSFERTVNEAGTINFALVGDNISLNEVIVVGYGKQTRKNVTSAVSVIQTDEIKRNPVASLSNTLAGRVTGVIAKQASGEPGSDGSQLYIRGVSTFNGSTNPLFVIDGIVRNQGDFSQLNPNEIESVSILKDASSAAIFGVRGANGVVLVTTRRGKTGIMSVNYSFNYSLQSVVGLPNFSDAAEYATLYNEALVNEKKAPRFTAADITKYQDGSDPINYPNTDWGKVMLGGSSPMSTHNLTINGGNEKARYFVSLSYLDQKGLYATLNNKRYNVRANVDLQVTKTTQFGIDLSVRLEDKLSPPKGVQNNFDKQPTSTGIFQEAFRNPPIYPYQFPDGKIANPVPYPNPFAFIQPEAGYAKNQNNVLLSTMHLTQDIPWVPGLSLKGVLAVDKSYGYFKTWNDNITLYAVQPNGSLLPTPYSSPKLDEGYGQYTGTELQGQINYINKIGDHNFSALALFVQKSSHTEYLNAARNTYSSSAIDVLNAGPSLNQNLSGGGDAYGLLSSAARINYDYKGRYLFQASIRQDQSENFAPDKRKGYFPAMSVGWIASEEGFIKDLVAVDFLKLRASYGKLGNDQVNSRFGYYARYDLAGANGGTAGGTPNNFGGYSFGNQYYAGLAPGPLANPNVTWESSTKTDIGIEFSIFKKLFSFEFDYFNERREGILATRNLSVPTSFGASLPTENIGIVQNKGYEITISHEKTIGKDFTYRLGGNITSTSNKIIFADESPNVSDALRRTDRPINGYYGLHALGIFKNQADFDKSPKTAYTTLGPGDVKYDDINGDGKIDDQDRTYLGTNNIPGIIYGITGGVTYKKLQLNFLFQGAEKVSQQLNQNAVWSFYNGGKVTHEWLDRWTPSNENASLPRVLINADNNQLVSDFWIKDASYLRLKNVEIAYTLSPKSLTNLGMKNLRLTVSGQNLLTFTKLLNVDPENTNTQGWSYPQQKVFNFGASIEF
jgi:TonB-linked SusC/RagA family outer membrane protein